MLKDVSDILKKIEKERGYKEGYLQKLGLEFLKKKAQPLIDDILKRPLMNIGRSNNLVKTSIYLEKNNDLLAYANVREYGDDLLRSAVVLTHATLEDFLRSIAATRLVFASEAIIDGIPLAGSRSSRAEKFFLGKLVEHRDKTVQELIQKSVEEFLAKSNFNDTTEISTLLKHINIDPECVRDKYQILNKMMNRRHQIVHRGDVKSIYHPDDTPDPIDASEVLVWISECTDFIRIISAEVILYDMQNYLSEELIEEFINSIDNLVID